MFTKQPVHCPACGTLHSERMDRAPHASAPGIELCCDEDCRTALRLAYSRYVLGREASHGQNPLRELVLSREGAK